MKRGAGGLSSREEQGKSVCVTPMGIKLQLRKQGKVGYGSSMSITTKRGDDGGTDLMFGKRIAKKDHRIEAIGSLD